MSDDMNHDDLEGLDHIEALLSELEPDDLEPVAVPAGVWEGIARRVPGTDPDSAVSAPVRSITESRRSRTVRWIVAAAAAVVLVVAATIAVVGRGTDDDVVSVADLTFDPEAFDPRGADAAADAYLLDRDGSYSIRLTDTNFP